MLAIETVDIKNFLSYESATLTFNRKEATLVIGKNKHNTGAVSNGSGKSALFEAVIFGLFGKTTGGRHGDNAVKDWKDGCCVTITGTSNGTPFTITRYRKHPIHKNTLNFIYGDSPIEKGSSKDTQADIERILEINFDLLLQTCYFSPSSIQTFCSMTDSEQKGIFQSILDLDKWEEALAKVKAQEAILDKAKADIKNKIQTNKQLKAKEQSILNQLLKEYKADNIDTSEEERRIKEYTEYITTHVNVNTKLIKVQEVLQDNRALENRCIASIYKVAKEIQEHTLLLEGKCPTCNGVLDTTVHSTAIQELELKKKEYEDQLQEARNTVSKASKLEGQLQTVSKLVSSYTGQVKILEEVVKSKSKLKSDIRKKLDQSRKILKEYNKVIKADSKLLDSIANKELLFKKLQVIFGATGVKTYLIKQVLPHLNNSLQLYSALICPDISVRIDAQKLMTTKQLKNKFDIQVTSKVGGNYKSLSSGEAKRVDLCIVFAFLDLIAMLGKQTNFLILDEILDNLDQAGEDIAITMLKNLKQDNIFLISHKSSLAARFNNVLVVEKDNNTSKIVLDG